MHGKFNRPADEHSAVPAFTRYVDTDDAAKAICWSGTGRSGPSEAAAVEDAGHRQGQSQNHAAEILATATGGAEVLGVPFALEVLQKCQPVNGPWYVLSPLGK